MQATSVATIDSASDFRFDHNDALSDLGGAASRFKFNVAAIALLKRLEAESRPPGNLTREERRYSTTWTERRKETKLWRTRNPIHLMTSAAPAPKTRIIGRT